MNLKNDTQRAVLLLLSTLLFWTNNAYSLNVGNTGGQIFGWEVEVTQSGDVVIPGTEVDDYNPTGPVSHNYPLPYSPISEPTIGIPTDSDISGLADPGNQQIGVFAGAWSDRTALFTGEIGNILIVGAAPSSNLQPGDPTTLTFTFRLDGTVDVSGSRKNNDGSYNNYSSWVDVSSRYRVRDAAIKIDIGEGIIVPWLINFEAGINYQEGANNGNVFNSYTWNWDVETWNGQTSGSSFYNKPYDESDSVFWELAPNQVRTCAPNSEVGHTCSQAKSFDTGVITLTIDTYIGAELEIYGRLNILSQARQNNTLAVGDFQDSLGASVSADDPNVVLTFDVDPDAANNPPAVPKLVFPDDNQVDVETTVTFRWKKSLDPEGELVTHRLHYCENADFSGCDPIEVASLSNTADIYFATGSSIVSAFMLAGIFMLGNRPKRSWKLGLWIGAAIMASAFFISCGSDDAVVGPTVPEDEISMRVSGLASGTEYHWKVIAEDENGGSTESETRSFTTK
jgi:hypothetical protein